MLRHPVAQKLVDKLRPHDAALLDRLGIKSKLDGAVGKTVFAAGSGAEA